MSKYIEVVIPRPVESAYIYEVPEAFLERVKKYTWVKVPFGRSTTQAYVSSDVFSEEQLPSDLKKEKIKPILFASDQDFIIPPDVWSLCEWGSKYYGSSLGEFLGMSFPAATLGLRSGNKKNKKIKTDQSTYAKKEIKLNPEQALVVKNILETRDQPKPILLEGVTGSGKTEVYIEVAKKILSEGRSVLLILPEIALTSQLQDRIEKGLGEKVILWHSAISPAKRRDETQALLRGEVRVVVGARSAVFCPLKNLGFIIIDEEHDVTFKQEERVRYHARDLAIVRAKETQSLIVLGSATPSFESLIHAQEQKYYHFKLLQRYGEAHLPEIEILDLKNEVLERINEEDSRSQIATRTVQSIVDTVLKNEQVMVYLNRRGFSPVLLCQDCGSTCECEACGVSLVYYKKKQELHCHLCGHHEELRLSCQNCQGTHLIPLGFGIESLEEDLESMILQRLAEKKNYDFKFKISRLDRDQITSQSRLDKTLDEFKKGESQILLGTQMLVKGHDFSNVTLVVVLFADALFRWPDFRAPERAFQTLTQVSGRSGRGLKKGKVMIQTMDPDHPVLKVITGQLSKDEFVKSELEIRKELEQPPFVRMIRYRLISKDKKDLLAHTDEYLKMLYRANEQLKNPIMILGPVQPLIEKLNHHFRQDVYLRSADIPNLRQLHTYAVALLRSERQKRSFDFQIDVDPISL